MKKHKRIPVTYQYFDYEGIQAYLERMASDGWRLVSIGTFGHSEEPSRPVSTTPSCTCQGHHSMTL